MSLPTPSGVAPPPQAEVPGQSATAVIDTNVVLDWLLFANPGVAPVAEAVMAGRLRWIACTRMRDELAHVLARGVPGWAAPADEVLARWDRWASVEPAPQPGASERLHCSDADDQVFIDLAVTRRAGWLLTRDRALLKLARRARGFGVVVVPPERWNADPS